jgi:mono/diheme cytochrome c family protein
MNARAVFTMTSLLLSTAAMAQEPGKPPVPEVKRVSITHTSSMTGKDLYFSYCAACHGPAGKGDGPAAQALKAAPTDLTTVARRNGGTFPAARMEAVIRGQASIPSHGSKEMPTWGQLFSSLSQGQEGPVAVRVNNLVKHLETLQAK